jgi:hypothetical protein
LFTTIDAMGTTDLSARVKKQDELGAVVAGAKPVNETVVIDGVRAPAGPSVRRIEEIVGQRFQRAHIDELLTQRPLEDSRTRGASPSPLPTADDLRRAGEKASQDTKAMSERGGRPPARLPMLRPPVERGLAPKPSIPNPAPKDTTAHRPGG